MYQIIVVSDDESDYESDCDDSMDVSTAGTRTKGDSERASSKGGNGREKIRIDKRTGKPVPKRKRGAMGSDGVGGNKKPRPSKILKSSELEAYFTLTKTRITVGLQVPWPDDLSDEIPDGIKPRLKYRKNDSTSNPERAFALKKSVIPVLREESKRQKEQVYSQTDDIISLVGMYGSEYHFTEPVCIAYGFEVYAIKGLYVLGHELKAFLNNSTTVSKEITTKKPMCQKTRQIITAWASAKATRADAKYADDVHRANQKLDSLTRAMRECDRIHEMDVEWY